MVATTLPNFDRQLSRKSALQRLKLIANSRLIVISSIPEKRLLSYCQKTLFFRDLTLSLNFVQYRKVKWSCFMQISANSPYH
ncbi:MAG: hypothetical protein P5694_08990 [Limnospira sp. PMC 1286.21]|uniref:Uncharacterized protein n=3 Tax=Limnospira TaxID=2596745 RepID=A0A9P1KFE0_9CYAN|nr:MULTISPECIES: hypothetical protein [Limnospira]AMW28944.1 hypothetical protein AP285_14240 [Arthrospira platensis YZ]EKD11649.1 hypothetical protein SPLC1_S010460 [Arthrospira platensis C1]MDT9187814.1 hypothetical protein [Limnospira sp. PMC 894.15]MDT9208336.1 hypothetical protein [Limnospira sp. PMC 1252.20]MDT9279897.1 hypothetical protein [Limnospira sp. PMC 1293.21]QJB27249.1 hypothetical protein HFV01_17495 [Limnospira fusiformis SAG 85.79]